MNQKRKYLYLIVGILLALASMLVPVWKVIKYEKQKQKINTESRKAELQDKVQKDVEEKLKSALAVADESISEGALFYENSVLYVPVSCLAEQKGAALVQADNVWYVQYQGNLTAMMEAYNIYLENQEPVNMRGCPVVKQGILYIPAMDLGNIFSMKVQVDEKSKMAVFGAGEILEEQDWDKLRKKMGVEAEQSPELSWKPEWEAQTGLSGQVLEIFIKENLLYHADEEGNLYQCVYTDQGVYEEIPCTQIPPIYESNGYYIDGEAQKISVKWDLPFHKKVERKKLYQVKKNIWKECGETPEAYRERIIMEELSVYMKEIAQKDRNLSQEQADTTFHNLIQHAEPGDFLVFKAEGADAKYGYFNHSALILEADKEEESIHVLHARSAELGVGADESMDTFTEQDLEEADYWKNYQLCYLVTPAEDISGKRTEITEKAYEMFNGYSFGYGSWLGKEETNCAELIEKAYETVGIELVKQDSVSSKLKEVLSGNAKNMVIVPDDLLLGGSVVVKAVWKK